MDPIPVEPFPFLKTYDSFRAAIDGANRHPLQQQAVSDTERLAGSSLANAWWSDSEFLLVFSSGQNLLVYLQSPEVQWKLYDSKPSVTLPHTIGATPQTLRWPRDVGDHLMDCSELIEKRVGGEFTHLFVNEMGLWVYMRSHLILGFSAIRRTDTGQCILHVWEDD